MTILHTGVIDPKVAAWWKAMSLEQQIKWVRDSIDAPREQWMIHSDSVKAWEAENQTFRDIIRQQREQVAQLIADQVEAEGEILELKTALRSDSANRYWEGRWRDEKEENERLAAQVAEAEKYNGWHQQAVLELEKTPPRCRLWLMTCSNMSGSTTWRPTQASRIAGSRSHGPRRC